MWLKARNIIGSRRNHFNSIQKQIGQVCIHHANAMRYFPAYKMLSKTGVALYCRYWTASYQSGGVMETGICDVAEAQRRIPKLRACRSKIPLISDSTLYSIVTTPFWTIVTFSREDTTIQNQFADHCLHLQQHLTWQNDNTFLVTLSLKAWLKH